MSGVFCVDVIRILMPVVNAKLDLAVEQSFLLTLGEFRQRQGQGSNGDLVHVVL